MRDITTKYGENAGKIWSILSEKGELKKEEIINVTKINEKDFHKGIGWLARENKIAQDNEYFRLENTNLEEEIGSHAGKVRKILDIWEDADIETIKRLSDLEDDQVHTALGWLAKEEKISTNEKNRFILKE